MGKKREMKILLILRYFRSYGIETWRGIGCDSMLIRIMEGGNLKTSASFRKNCRERKNKIKWINKAINLTISVLILFSGLRKKTGEKICFINFTISGHTTPKNQTIRI